MLGHFHYGNIDFRILMLITVIAIDGTLIGTALSLPFRIVPLWQA
ncbi:MAG: hypothetical protein JETT_0568 [Candidatus Jettenia ecosi]|uniref:Uncharacterized protein n=1 Tax=Candidatus Jettenia ecosi TaxID=2494326 RepID=A0A533QEE6_9BACT|nr:MAG: hypothetical protein JETT_0568 [Candidatus Jettenia ecosi]